MIESYLIEAARKSPTTAPTDSPLPIHASDGTIPKNSSKKSQKNVKIFIFHVSTGRVPMHRNTSPLKKL